ncbi:MAG: PAS domain S-box protein [Syntrophobacteraceae bacterium]
MPNDDEQSRKFSRLRQQAEEMLKDRPGVQSHSTPDMLELIHELEVHQAELQIQNEELRRAQGEISKLHREYEDLYEFAPCGYVTLNPKGIITRCNLSGVAFLGAEKCRLKGVGFSSLVAPESWDNLWVALRRAGQSGEKQSVELQLARADGEPLWVVADIQANRTEAGGVTQWRLALVDITSRKQAEEGLRDACDALERRVCERTTELSVSNRDLEVEVNERKRTQAVLSRSEERFRSLVTATSQMVWTTNPKGEVTDDIPTWRAFTGQGEQSINGWGWIEALHPEDRRQTAEIWNQAVHSKTLYETEYRVRRHDGEYRLFCARGVPILGDNGGIREWVGTCTDITERKQAEARLRKSEDRFREIAENIREIFWVRTRDEILYISPAYEEIWGRSRESLYEDPSSFIELVHPEDRERVIKANNADLEGVASLDEQYRIIRQDGAVRWIWTRSFPIREQDELVRTVGIAEDITLRKQAEELLHIERDLALGLGSVSGLTEALELLLEACLKIDDLDCGGIYLVEREAGALRLLHHQGLSPGFVERISFYGPTSPQTRFAMQGEPGYWTNPVGILGMSSLFKEEGLKTLASIPVKSVGEVVALLNVSSHNQAEIHCSVRASLESIAGHIGEIISRVRFGETIKVQSERLEEANTALRVLLRQRELDKADLEESILSNVKHLVLPYLDKLKRSRLTDDQRHLLEFLEFHLREITSPFVRKISAPVLGLTPAEIRVAELIRQGTSSKEIADLLVTSESAVVFHRHGIRRKLGLIGKQINLQAYLVSLL